MIMLNTYKKNNPIISVILPTFNRGYCILNAMISVINQTYPNWELIVVDDGSNDNTFEILREYIEKYDNILYIKHANRGVALTMNVGLRNATGSYSTFLGSDDYYRNAHLEQRITFMKSNPEIDLIHGGVIINGNPYVYDKTDLSKKIHLQNCIIGGTIFAKTEVLLKLKGFKNLSYSSESDLYERALSTGFKIAKVEFQTYIYNREDPKSITNSIKNN